ncbi:MAG: CoA-binding protein [Deltaproteobacteria bacterium]|nr:CoA-binding protein [Deltaproteobacteria bacterium]
MQKRHDLTAFFSPSSIALVGASPSAGKISGIILENLRNSFKGAIYPVNPHYNEVMGLRCHPSIEAIGSPVDLAVYALGAESVPEAILNTGGNAAGAVVVSGGFAEAGPKGVLLEKALKDAARSTGIRVIGPNCLGIYDAVTGLDTFFVPRDRVRRPGRGTLSIISQSGSFAATAIDELATDGIGVARVVSYGNKSDVDEADCLDFLAEDPETKAVAIYVESIEDGRRFVESAARCSAIKPVMAVKVGKSASGISAARSHTGAIAGSYEIYRAAFRKAGIIELNGYEDFLVACKAFGLTSGAAGKRVMIITDGGGMGVNVADECIAAGLTVPPLPEELIEELSAAFPPYFTTGNPLDLTGSATDESFAFALSKTMSGDYYDMVIVAALWGPPALTDNLPGMLAQKPGFNEKPIIACTPGGAYSRERIRLFHEAGLPAFLTPEAAVTAACVLSKRQGRR